MTPFRDGGAELALLPIAIGKSHIGLDRLVFVEYIVAMNNKEDGKADGVLACSCSDWGPNAELINSALAIRFIHGFGGDSVKIFSYCPWCGKDLKEKPA